MATPLQKRKLMSEINVVPYIDVMLVLLVIFMVAGVHFLREMLFMFMNKVLLGIKSRVVMNVTTIIVVAVLSAFLDALTILAVLIALATAFYDVYERWFQK